MAQKAQMELQEPKPREPGRQSRKGRPLPRRPETGLVRRLRQAMDRQGINPLALAERAAVGSSFVYDILNGKSANPTTRNLSAVAQALGVSLSYLLHGKEESDGSYAGSPLASSSGDGELAVIPALCIKSSRGGGKAIADDDISKPYYFHRAWIERKLHTSPENLRIIFVQGDGMAPTLGDSDMMLIDISRNAPPPGIFVLFDSAGLTVKRLEYAGEENSEAMVRVISDNRRYGHYERTLASLCIVGRAVWFSRRLD